VGYRYIYGIFPRAQNVSANDLAWAEPLRTNLQEPVSTTAKELANEARGSVTSDYLSRGLGFKSNRSPSIHINDCAMLKSKCLYLPYTLQNLDLELDMELEPWALP